MKKNCKRLGALLLALVMVLSLVPVTALAARREDDAVPMIAPDTTVDLARPAGAVDAEEVPAVLAEGETNIAQGKTVYVSGLEVSGTTTDANKAVDSHDSTAEPDNQTRWSSNYMKVQSGTANGSNPAWIVVDLAGDGAVVESITSISMEYYKKVWGSDYVVQVAGNDYTPADFSSNIGVVAASAAAFQGQHAKNAACWTTIKTYSNHTNTDNPTDTVNATDFENAIPKGTRYLRLYYTKMNGDAGGDAIGLENIAVMGTIAPAYTFANINAGLFDVGATATKGADGTWTANYSNPDGENALITASAPSYHNSGPARGAVDGSTSTLWHSNYGSDAGTGYNDNETTGLAVHPEARYIQLDLREATEISALRYMPKAWEDWVNAIVTRYEIKVCDADPADDDSTWTTVAIADSSTNWDAAYTAAGNPADSDTWFVAYFDQPVTTKHVRLYGVTTKGVQHADGKHMAAREVRLVKAGGELEKPEYTLDNVNAGLFDVGTTPFKTADGSWTPNYCNPLTAPSNKDGWIGDVSDAATNWDKLGGNVYNDATKVKAHAPSWDFQEWTNSYDIAPYVAVDGDTTSKYQYHTNYGGGAGPNYNNTPSDADKANRFLQLEITEAGGGAQKLAGIRIVNNSNIPSYEIKVSTDGTDWTTAKTGTSLGASGNWQYIAFNEPVEAKYVRLCRTDDTFGAGDGHLKIKEVRLVKAATDVHTFTGTVVGSDGTTAIAGATVSAEGVSATTESDGSFIMDLPYPTCIATVTKDGLKTRTVALTEDTAATIQLYAPLSGEALAGVNGHLWDYPLWTDDAGANVHGGSVTAFSWANTDNDLPPWAAIDSNSNTLWHSRYGSTGQAEDTGNVGKWYEFTLGTPTKIIGLWYMSRSNGANQPENVTIKVSNGDTSPTAAEWAALPGAGNGSMNTTTQEWKFVELAAPVEAKYVRIYPDNPGDHVVIAELRVVMDPGTSGAKHVAGTVTASTDGAAIEGATLKVANHTATSGSDGSYDLGYLPAGTYTVTASAAGYQDKTQEVTIGEGELAAVDLAMETQALTLNVTVTGTGGATVDGATVTLERNDTSKLPVAGVASVTSGTNGVYTVDATQAGMGTYVVRVSHPDYNIGTANVTFSNTATEASATVALTARSAPEGSGGELVKEYDFSDASQVNDFVALVSEGGATVEHDATKGAMKITFVDDANSYKNLILNKKFVIKNGSFEFDVTAEGTVGATADFGTVLRYGDGKWLHVGQLNAVNGYGATTHTASDASTSYNGQVTNVALGNGVTRRFNSMLGMPENNGTFMTERTILALESVVTNWKWTHPGSPALPISNAVGLWGFGAKNANGLVVYIDNLKVYRRTAQKGEVTIGELSDGTLTVNTVTELDSDGTALQSGDSAFEGDTIKISASGVPDGKVFAVKVTKTSDAATVVNATKAADGSYFTFTMPAYGVTITPSAATELTGVTVTGADYGEEDAKYARVGNTLTVSDKDTWGDGVSYQWQYSGDGTNWTNISGATSASFTLTGTQYNTSNAKNQVRVVVTGNDVAYHGTVNSAAVDVEAALVEVSGVTFAHSNITMWTNYDADPVTGSGAEEGKTTTITATITPSSASRPMTVTWASSAEDVIGISEESTTATEVTTESGTALQVSAKLTAKKASATPVTITCTVTAKDGTQEKVATVTVTAKTAIKTLTLKNGTRELNSAADVVTIYANADGLDADAGEVNTVTVNATVDEGASAEGLYWSCGHSETDYKHIFVVGDVEHADSASGDTVSITAYAEHDRVGTETVTVTAPATSVPTGVTPPSKTFTVKVIHKIGSGHSVSIGGTPKVDTKLSVNYPNLPMSDTDKENLTYQWYRGEVNEENKIAGAEGVEYTPTASDVGSTISVVVTATPKDATGDKAGFYYEGSLNASTTAPVAKKDAPATPSLSFTQPSSAGQADATITISGYDSENGYTYQIKGGGTDAEPMYTDWNNATVTDAGKIENLKAGKYYVKILGAAGQEDSAEATVTIPDGDVPVHTISVTQPSGAEGMPTISVNSQAAEGTEVTITLSNTTGWNVSAVTVTGASGSVTVTQGEGAAANTWTFTMPTEDVTVTATVSKIKVNITHNLTNVKCNENHAADAVHEVDYGTHTTITLSPVDDSYELDTGSIKVTQTGSEDDLVGTDAVSYSNGTLTFKDGVTQNITITATANKKTYSVSFRPQSGSNLTTEITSELTSGKVEYNKPLTVKLKPASGYSAPDKASVTVAMTGTTSPAFEYTKNADGTATLTIAQVTGDVTITASGELIKTALTGVTIEIEHDDSTVSNQNVPHVGDTLQAVPVAGDKTGITANYTWYVGSVEVTGGLQDATGETYTVRSGDTGKKIKVVATGTGAFDGTVTSSETEPVGDKVYAVSGVSLNKTSTSLVFKEEETLTATVVPPNATNKNVSWKSSNTAVATVDANGKVTAVGVGTATITVTTEDGGQTATCTVTVTAKDLTSDTEATVRVGGTLELGQTVNAVLKPDDAADDASYAWYIVNADGSNETHIMDASDARITLPTDSSNLGKKVKLVVTYGGNYTGTKTRITDNVIKGELPTHAVSIASNIANGSVTASPTAAKAGETVTLTVTPASGYELGTLTVTSDNYGTPVETDKVDATTYTFIMPGTLADDAAVNVTATFVEEGSALPTYTVTIGTFENGTVTADKTEAKEGATVTLTVEPSAGYKLGSLTVTTDEGGEEVDVTDNNTFVMPGEGVTVTATFAVDTKALEDAITAAKALANGVQVKEDDPDPSTVSKGTKYVASQDVLDALNTAITTAEAADTSTAAAVKAAVDALNEAVDAFNDELKVGTKQTSRPSSSGTTTSKVTNPDGSVTTTVTQPDGTKTVTTEQPDGTVESVKTQPDGTVVETTITPDGVKESVMTRPDGTVTETVTDAEGAITEKVTDPEENVVITVTDPEGEELAKVELPAELPAPETKFDDIGGHWAEDSINKVAALGLVNGVGGSKYGTESALTRGQLATVLYRLSNGKSGYRVTFSDVENGKYYTEGVAWAAKAKVVNGYSADVFAPNDVITREQLATMLCRYAKLIGMDTTASSSSLSTFADGGNTNKWAVDGVAWCVEKGILRGMSAETLAPNANVTRAQVAVMLDRFIALIK